MLHYVSAWMGIDRNRTGLQSVYQLTSAAAQECLPSPFSGMFVRRRACLAQSCTQELGNHFYCL